MTRTVPEPVPCNNDMVWWWHGLQLIQCNKTFSIGELCYLDLLLSCFPLFPLFLLQFKTEQFTVSFQADENYEDLREHMWLDRIRTKLINLTSTYKNHELQDAQLKKKNQLGIVFVSEVACAWLTSKIHTYYLQISLAIFDNFLFM